MDISQRVSAASTAFNGPCFVEIFSCASWNIWKERNNFIFKGIAPLFGR